MENANNAIIPVLAPAPATLFTPTPKAAKRLLEFFTAQINNDHMRKAYLNATRRFAEWCTRNGLYSFKNPLTRQRWAMGITACLKHPNSRLEVAQ
jgi:hypothetical protein